MKSKIIISFVVLIVLLFPPNVSADVLFPGYKDIGYCFEVSNVNDYPDYVFIAYTQGPMAGHKVINQGDCVDFYKFSNPTVFAIERTKFNESDIGTEFEEEKNYFETNPNIISSGIEINIVSTVQENDPTQAIRDILEIISVGDGNFEIKKSKVFYRYVDGFTEEIDYINQDERPEPSRKPILPLWFSQLWYIIIPLIAIIIIGLIIRSRRARK